MISLSDPQVQSLLALAALIATIIGYVITYLRRQRKSLGYAVTSLIPLTSLQPQTLSSYQSAGLQITYRGETIPQAHVIAVKFTNIGNVPIKREDYDVPISLTFGEGTKPLTWRFVEKKPETIELNSPKSDDTGKLTIEPVLLNPKDSFTVEMLVSGLRGHLKLGGRIVGVKEIKNISGGLPTSREEGMVNEAFFFSLYIMVFALIYAAYFVVVISGIMFAISVWRKITRQRIREQSKI